MCIVGCREYINASCGCNELVNFKLLADIPD